MVRNVLMVAEKPSLAEAISHHLSNGSAAKRPRALPVYEYSGQFFGMPAFFKVTSTTGHIFGCDFTPEYQNWHATEEEKLFSAPTVKKENTGAKVVHHLQKESEGCDAIVLWLDCDREGENICFEVLNVVKKNISRWDCIWRAKFSAITSQELRHAMDNLIKPNKFLSDSVEFRQELDLKVGCAFTRFQTKYFQGKYGDLDASVVSYGPCQTPTLGFAVQRHDEILQFKPESFWKIVPVLNRGGTIIQFDWERRRIFDEPIARLLHQKISSKKTAKVIDVSRTKETKPRPAALNTVELLKVASSKMGISPAVTMNLAEHLYTSGYISYPRTESTSYASSFNLVAVLQDQKSSGMWGAHVQQLLEGAMVRPKAGVDMGDHPPITPTRYATPGELHGDSWKIYEYITRHFIATVSPDCKYARTKIVIDIDGEKFAVSGKIVEDPGWTAILTGLAVKDEKLPEVEKGDDLQLSDIRLQAGTTQPPGYLTESDLIGLMEKHGIGTDASIPQHIKNICDRNYVQVKSGRTIEPTKLGIILVHGYQSIDPELVLPLVRAHVEELGKLIAEGKVTLDEVLDYAVRLFNDKFRFFRDHIQKMDSLMEASFSPISQTGAYLVKCGICNRYMRYLNARPQRLYCQTCAVTLNLPQGGTCKQYSNFTCPLDNFELVICHIDGGKSTVICPHCFNNPPFEDQTKTLMSCADCKHPTCGHSLAVNYVSDCIDESCTGCMAFVKGSTGKWKCCCNTCQMMIMLPPTAQRVCVRQDEDCPQCGAQKMEFTFPKGKSPLANRAEHIIGCIYCDETLLPHVQEVRGRVGNFGRGGTGRGRGRGGRGRGRGRGRRDRD